jgi:hypothetical protein
MSDSDRPQYLYAVRPRSLVDALDVGSNPPPSAPWILLLVLAIGMSGALLVGIEHGLRALIEGQALRAAVMVLVHALALLPIGAAVLVYRTVRRRQDGAGGGDAHDD